MIEERVAPTVEYDAERDILKIEGVEYSAGLFRCFARPIPDGLYRIWRQNGTVCLTLIARDEWPEIIGDEL